LSFLSLLAIPAQGFACAYARLAANPTEQATVRDRSQRAKAAYTEHRANLRAEHARQEHLPFMRLIEDGKPHPVAVLLHGVGESPRGMQEMAQWYSEQGYHVLGILLDGHGREKPEAMLGVTPDQWRGNIDYVLNLASQVGKKV